MNSALQCEVLSRTVLSRKYVRVRSFAAVTALCKNDDFCVAQCCLKAPAKRSPCQAAHGALTPLSPRQAFQHYNVTRKQRRKGASGPGRGGRSRRRRVALGLVARLARESRRFSAAAHRPNSWREAGRCTPPALLRRGRPPRAAAPTARSRVEQRRERRATSSSCRRATRKSFSTSSAPLLDAIVSSSASETVRLSERYTLLARSASELLPLLDRRDGVLSELNWRDGVLRATGRGFASPVVSLVNAPAKETRMRSSTASGVAVQVAVVDARKPWRAAQRYEQRWRAGEIAGIGASEPWRAQSRKAVRGRQEALSEVARSRPKQRNDGSRGRWGVAASSEGKRTGGDGRTTTKRTTEDVAADPWKALGRGHVGPCSPPAPRRCRPPRPAPRRTVNVAGF